MADAKRRLAQARSAGFHPPRSSHPTPLRFVYDKANNAQTYVEQFEAFVLQTLDTSKHFKDRDFHDRKYAVVPSVEELTRHLRDTRMMIARDYNALLRLILSGHAVTVKRDSIDSVPHYSLFGGAPKAGETPVTEASYTISHDYNGIRHQLRVSSSHLTTPATTRVELYENGHVKHSYSYISPCSVFVDSVVEGNSVTLWSAPDRRYEQSDTAKHFAAAYLEATTVRDAEQIDLFINGILPWLAAFFLKGELPLYNKSATDETATVRTYADLTLNV